MVSVRVFGLTIKIYRTRDTSSARSLLAANPILDHYVKGLEQRVDRFEGLITKCRQCQEILLTKQAFYMTGRFESVRLAYCLKCYIERMAAEPVTTGEEGKRE